MVQQVPFSAEPLCGWAGWSQGLCVPGKYPLRCAVPQPHRNIFKTTGVLWAYSLIALWWLGLLLALPLRPFLVPSFTFFWDGVSCSLGWWAGGEFWHRLTLYCGWSFVLVSGYAQWSGWCLQPLTWMSVILNSFTGRGQGQGLKLFGDRGSWGRNEIPSRELSFLSHRWPFPIHTTGRYFPSHTRT